MSLFQKSVINKYLKSLNQAEVEKSFLKFKKFYGNPKRIENIRLLKEENYQEGFFREIFVQVLGYTINPDENYNLTTEFKNQTDAKKADGAILRDGKAIGVIELKSTKTTSLESITEQAFNYKNHQPNCRYIITSNFEKVRFYIDNATDFEEFNLFTLSEKEFKILYLILSKKSIFNEIPLKLKKESVLHEENISKQLYHDYSQFKRKIFENLVKNNPQFDKLTLFKKSQKLLDRFLFILFGEDSGLVPPNAVSKIINQWKTLEELDEAVSLYSRFVKFFHHLDIGYKYKTFEVHAYNGGLFREDKILNSVRIDDEILLNDSLKLSSYDFQTEIDVNILGHIFENSLNEIEELTAEFEGKAVDKKKTKRKKEGVYYTPKYITKYIVENTVGELCNQKKKELNLDKIDISIIQNSRTKQGKLNHKAVDLLGRLKTYSDYLLSLKILDPACGSGAFLNQALEFLLEEHQFVDEYRRQLEKDSLGLFDIKKSILENNIFGVDINEESVEIAKLSLWLRTAERGRKLSELSNTIKCGNSLIDDPEVAGEKAFKWEEEFPQVFKIKEEKAWHITFATHDSRASQRMIDHKVRLRRHNGTRPYAMPVWLEMEDEIKVTEYISGVIKEDKLKVPAYNICGEHVHLILVCEKEERDGIVGKIKAVSSRQYNIWAGKTIPATKTDAPDADKGTGTVADTGATVTDTGIVATRGHVPLSASSPKQHTPSSEKPRAQAHLWTQKYGKKEITDQKQLYNTIEYINNNRKKHGLPFSKELQSIVQEMTCSIDHAFQTEYKGGFDVVIGNPPYLRIQGLKDACPQMALYYEEHYTSATGNYDLYALFIENSFRLINETGYVSFILPHKFLIADFGIGIRGFLLENRALKELIHFGSELVFQDSTTYTCIISLSKREKSSFSFKHIVPAQLFNEISFSEILYNKLAEKQWILTDNKIGGVLNKLSNQPLQLKDVFDRFVQGVITGKDAVFCVSGDLNGSYLEIETETGEKRLIEKDILKPHLRGEDVGKYKHLVNNEWLIFPYKLDAKKAELFTPNEMIDKFPRTFEYLKLFEPILRERENGKFDNEYWYQYSRNQAISVLEQAKIITPEICNGGSMTLDLNNFYHNSKCHTLLINRNSGYMLKSILPFINSRLFWFFISNTGNILRGNYIGVKRRVLEPFPVPSSDVVNHDFFIQLTDEIMKQTSDFQNIQSNFNDLLQNKFEIEKLSNKLQNWHKLKFKEFLKELKKAKVQLSLSEEAEWMEFFNIQKHKAVDLQTEIDCIDKEIDQMVYELYGLNEEEIQIVENSFEKLN